MDTLDFEKSDGPQRKGREQRRLILYYAVPDFSFRDTLARLCGYDGFEQYAKAAVEEKVARDSNNIKEMFEKSHSHKGHKARRAITKEENSSAQSR